MPWDPARYLTFAEPRLRPALELLSRVGAERPGRVLDLGCGAGNVTAHLARRWPEAQVIGVDNSVEMLERARADHTGPEWLEADLATWEPGEGAGVVYSNAALHWLDDHHELFPRLAAWLAPGGWLAVQMPDNHSEPSHQLLFDTADSGPWAATVAPLLRRAPVSTPADYHGLLAPVTDRVDVWTTSSVQVLEGRDPVLAWTRGSVLRPVLAALGEEDQNAFLEAYGAALRAAYPPGSDGRTLFPFRRLFIVARAGSA